MSVYLAETLDVTRTGVQKTISGVYMGDSEKTLQIILTKGDEPYTPPSGSRAILYTEKPDGTHGVYEYEIQNGYVFAPIVPQMVAVPGNVRCQVEIVTMNQTALFCPEFILTVARPVPDEIDVESYDDFQALEDLLQKGGVRTVSELPEATQDNPIKENTIVYLADVGLHRYTDGAWAQLTDDEAVEAISELQEASHSHANKSTLDTVTAEKVTSWDAAVSASHGHTNKSVLDTVTSEKTASWDAAAAGSHSHANKSTLDTVTAEKVTSWDAAASGSHGHTNKSVLDTVTAEKVTSWDAAAAGSHGHTNKSVLDQFTVSDGAVKFNDQYLGIEVVSSLPDVQIGKFVFRDGNARLYYGRSSVGWTQIADGHFHSNKDAVDRITGTVDKAFYNGKEIPLIAPDDVLPLGFETYSDLVVRDEAVTGESIMDVPVFVQGEQGTVCSLYKYTSDPVGLDYDDGVELSDLRQYDTGMPLFVVSVTVGGVRYAYFPQDYNGGLAGMVYAGWNVNNQPSDPPTITSFTPDRFSFGGVVYDDLDDLPVEAQSALRSLSQCVNVSAAAMGTIRAPEDAVTRFSGTFETNRKYHFITGSDCTFTLPSVPFTETDAQFVLFLTCTQDVDLTFPQGTRFVGGTAPNSDAGSHKIIGCWLKDAGAWAIGGIDYSEVS